MSTTDTTSRWEYNGDGVTTIFPYDNIIYAAEDMVVIVDGVTKTLTADYTVSNVGVPTGGNVTIPVPPAVGVKNVILERNTPATQTAVFPAGDKFPSSVVERAFDKLTTICQQILRGVSRCISLSPTVTGSVSLQVTPEAGKLLGWADDGSGLVNKLYGTADIPLPVSRANGGWGAALTTDASMRNAIGLGSAATQNVGTAANNVVQLDAAGKLPAVNGANLTGITAGRLLNVVVYTASGTYNKNMASSFVVIYVLGAGGGAGSTSGMASLYGGAQSGAGGGCAIKKILTSALAAAETVTVGAAGGGASNAAIAQGSAGGTSSFGAWCSATGGAGGVGRQGQGVTGTVGVGGIGSGGDINLRGDSCPMFNAYGTGTQTMPGARGAGPFGGAGAQANSVTATAGYSADPNSGAGGASGIGAYNATTPIVAGGNGGTGLVVIFEYA